MKPGQTVYLGQSRIEAVFQGIAANGFVKVVQGGRPITLHRDKVRTCRRARPSAYFVGEAVKIAIHGIDNVFAGEVVDVEPVKARVTEFDPVWNGAVVGTKDARIMREDASGAE